MSYLNYSRNFHGVAEIFMRDPKRYLPFMQLTQGIMNGPSELSTAEREMIALYVSRINDCEYCVGAHTAVLEGLGVEDAAIKGMVSGDEPVVGSRMAPVLKFARTLTLSPGEVKEGDMTAMRESGFEDQTIEDVIGVVSLFSFFNRLADGFGLANTPDVAKRAGMIAAHGYGPVVQMLEKESAAA